MAFAILICHEHTSAHNFTLSNTPPPWMFFTLFKLCKGTKSRKASCVRIAKAIWVMSMKRGKLSNKGSVTYYLINFKTTCVVEIHLVFSLLGFGMGVLRTHILITSFTMNTLGKGSFYIFGVLTEVSHCTIHKISFTQVVHISTRGYPYSVWNDFH